jgi:hypothetical protein
LQLCVVELGLREIGEEGVGLLQLSTPKLGAAKIDAARVQRLGRMYRRLAAAENGVDDPGRGRTTRAAPGLSMAPGAVPGQPEAGAPTRPDPGTATPTQAHRGGPGPAPAPAASSSSVAPGRVPVGLDPFSGRGDPGQVLAPSDGLAVRVLSLPLLAGQSHRSVQMKTSKSVPTS